ncbi:MAG: acyl-CoA dehydrogenase family protein [Mycobacterium sp.]|nr:acyl-CoA dehydrogenase family protein [Mycobacterium sp.]
MGTDYENLCAAGSELNRLRVRVNQFLRADSAEFGWKASVDAWLASWDEAFSTRLGAAGFLGLTIPSRYGGRGLGHLHRYVVTEQLLLHGAPVAAHWFADRQVAPALSAYGSEHQRRTLLPEIAAGRLYCAIGLSEDGAGSDLAAAVTRARRTDGGWLLNGRKTWTSGAHRAHLIVVLARTGAPDPAHRHAGFGQFLIARDAPGVTVSPIAQMSGEHHFNEVTFTDVFVADADVLGEIGNGWQQITTELSFERSGPERILSTAPLLAAVLRSVSDGDRSAACAAAAGNLVAGMVSLRQLSISVANTLTQGRDAASRAAMVKDLGTGFEQYSVDACAEMLSLGVDPGRIDAELRDLLAAARLHAPMFTLRGGTNEVLRGVVARDMGLR